MISNNNPAVVSSSVGIPKSSAPIKTKDPLFSTSEKILIVALNALLVCGAAAIALVSIGVVTIVLSPLIIGAAIAAGVIAITILIYKAYQGYKESAAKKDVNKLEIQTNRLLKNPNYLEINEVEKKWHDLEMRLKSANAKQQVKQNLSDLEKCKTNANPKVKILQRRWRSRLRGQLQNKKQTFEQWRNQIHNKKQIDNLNQEIQRLEKSGVAALARQHLGYSSWACFTSARKQAIVVVGRALERKKIYQDTHYVFTHGQSLYVSVLNDFMKELSRAFTPLKYHAQAPYFRVPELVPQSDNVNAFFKKYDPHTLIDDNINSELLSVDGVLENNDVSESALHFFKWNSNISEAVARHAFYISQHYLGADPAIYRMISGKINAIASYKNQEASVGALYTICVPKKVVENPKKNFVYRSHAYGRKCTCHPDNKFTDVLNDHQKNKFQKCGWIDRCYPQYRMVTSAMSRDTTVRSFRFTAIAKPKQKEYRLKIRHLVQELHVYARILKLTAAPSKQELDALKHDIDTLVKLKDFDKTTLKSILAKQKNFVTIDL